MSKNNHTTAAAVASAITTYHVDNKNKRNTACASKRATHDEIRPLDRGVGAPFLAGFPLKRRTRALMFFQVWLRSRRCEEGTRGLTRGGPSLPSAARGTSHLVADEVDRVVGVAVLQQEVGVDRPGDYSRLETAKPLELRVSGGHGPHGHGVEKVHVLGGRLLPTNTGNDDTLSKWTSNRYRRKR